MSRRLRWATTAAVLLAGCVAAPGLAPVQVPIQAPPPVLPEAASGSTAQPGWAFQRMAVVAAHPLAAEAGWRMLRAGGNAIDAAVAVQMVLALVEPQSSGIGGGAFLMLWDGNEVQAWDGRETAPAAADERQFLDTNGKALPLNEAVFGGRSVGVPGALRMLEAVHRRHGVLPWAQLFQPAIMLAENGVPIGPRLHALLKADRLLRRDALARAHFYAADGEPHPVGHVLRNPALAAVLRAIAAGGSAALHTGPIAADLVARVQGHAAPGRLNAADLSGYAAVQREPLCTVWRQVYRLCGFPPPSSGHLALMQTLGMMDAAPALQSSAGSTPSAVSAPTPDPKRDPLATGDGVPSAEWLHVYLEASKLAYADRALFVADPAFTPAPGGRWDSLLNPAYLQQRATLIGPRAMAPATAGEPAGRPSAWAPMPDQPEHGTSHVSIVDAEGRAVALTTSVESAFGARLMADGGTGLPGGYLLNNQLTDFSFVPADALGRPVANRLQPGKRPRSSMSPMLVFDTRSGRLLMVGGSAGGPFIPHFMARTLLATLAWGLDAQTALGLPHVANLNGPTFVEAGRFSADLKRSLQNRGHVLTEIELTSGTHVVTRTPQGWFAAADPRREGRASGE